MILNLRTKNFYKVSSFKTLFYSDKIIALEGGRFFLVPLGCSKIRNKTHHTNSLYYDPALL